MERILRTANSFREAAAIDRRDVAAMSVEERISGVERLREVWFDEDRAPSRLLRVLVVADRPSRSLRAGRRARVGRDALLRNKRASGRPKDLLDVALPEAHPSSPRTARARPRRKRETRGSRRG